MVFHGKSIWKNHGIHENHGSHRRSNFHGKDVDFTHASHASMGKTCKVKSMEKHGKAWDTDHVKTWNSMGKTCEKTMENT